MPAYCSYVVKLYKFIETDNAIYLILEHASGGKLWSYASGYLSQCAESSNNQALVCSLERSIGSCGSRRSRNSSASSKENRKNKEEIYGENVFQDPEEAPGVTPSPGKRYRESEDDVKNTDAVGCPGGGNGCVSLVTDSANSSGRQVMTPDPIASEFAELDIQDTETNLNDLVSQYSQYGNVYSNGTNEASHEIGETNGRTNGEIRMPMQNVTAPMNLFSIDSLESPGSELHSAGSADKAVFGFGTPPGSPKSGLSDRETSSAGVTSQSALSTWIDPEDVIADALTVMKKDDCQIAEFDSSPSNGTSARSEYPTLNSLPPRTTQLDTLPDTSGFATAMTDEMTSSTPGTDLAEFFYTGAVAHTGPIIKSEARPPPLRRSVSVQERGVSRDGPLGHRKYSNPMDFQVRSVTFQDQRPDGVLSSLMQVNTSVDKGGFGSVSEWEVGRPDTSKSEPKLRSMLVEATSTEWMRYDTDGPASGAAKQPEMNSNNPVLVLPQDLNIATCSDSIPKKQNDSPSDPSTTTPSSLSPTSNQESLDNTLYSSCESTPKHALYSPEWDSGAVMDSSSIEIPDQPLANRKVHVAKTREYRNSNPSDLSRSIDDSDMTPTHQSAMSNNTVPPSSTAGTTRPGPIPKPRDAPLPSLSTLFARMDEQVKVTKSSTLPESCVRLWAAEILLALTDLHAVGIICQDLRPDNILLADGGHIRLTYFSQWQYVARTLNAFAKDHLYTAPEVNGIFNVTPACDWWSFGVILYELLTGMVSTL